MKYEPVAFWDWTRSMSYDMSDGLAGIPANDTPRHQVLTPAMKTIVTHFYEMDTAADEAKEIDPKTGLPAGGTLTYIISGEHSNPLGDLNPHNWSTLTAGLVPHGGTYIMPQIRQWEQDRDAEFKAADATAEEQRTYCLVIPTDGALDNDRPRRGGPSDREAFEQWLTDPKGGARDDIVVVLVLVGNGEDTREALPDYQSIAQRYQNKVKLVNCMGGTSQTIASDVLSFFK